MKFKKGDYVIAKVHSAGLMNYYPSLVVGTVKRNNYILTYYSKIDENNSSIEPNIKYVDEYFELITSIFRENS